MFFFFNFFKEMPMPQPFLSLAQVPGLERLPEVCEEFDIEISAFGSAVRRLARHLSLQSQQPLPDLFSLAPFLSDINLSHTGRPEQADSIREAILARVPYSECFRWEILSEAELRPFREDEERLPVIPANKLTLATRAGNGIQDPFNGVEDIRSGKFRFLPSNYYYRSNLCEQQRDCGLLHALLFLQVVCEHGGETLPEEQPGWEYCKALIDPVDSDTLIALGESAYLRAKVVYRLQALRSVCHSEQRWGELVDDSGLWDWWPFRWPNWFPQLWLPINGEWSMWPLISSCRLGGDVFRLSDSPMDDGTSSAESLWGSLSNDEPVAALSKHPIPKLEKGQKVVAASPRFRLTPGRAASSGANEYIHFEFQIHQPEAEFFKKHPLSDLGVLVALTGEERTSPAAERKNQKTRRHTYVMSLPSVCSVREYQFVNSEVIPLMQTRINFGRILDVFPNLLLRAGLTGIESHSLRVFIVAEHE